MKILFISSFHPGGCGQIGAGEAISGDILKDFIAKNYSVDVYVLSPEYQRENSEIVSQCNKYVVRKTDKYTMLQSIAANFTNGSFIAPWFFTRVQRDAICKVREMINANNYDFIWLDFPSSLGFAASLSHPDIRYCAHDIVAQRMERSYAKRWLSGFVRTIESSLFKKLSRISVLSEKDHKLVHDMGFLGDVSIIPLGEQKVGVVDDAVNIDEIVNKFSGKKNLVFFGNMKRAENHWSIIWFVLFVFIRAYRKEPNLNLWILGICPRFSLRFISKLISSVHVVGAVDDPSLAFKKADLCIAPLLFGAGVKIKVIQMLDAGGRVLATPVGAEGVAENERLMVFSSNEIYKALLQEVNKCCHFH